MKQFTSRTQKIGEYGEQIAEMFLMKHSYTIIETNYTVPFGEIDIIATKNKVIHFIEVKSLRKKHDEYVSPETYKAEYNFSKSKQIKMKKTIEHYLMTQNVPHETPFQVDLFSIYIDPTNTKHRIRILDNIML